MPLDDTDRALIAKYEARLQPALAEARKMMAAINAVHMAADEPEPYQFDGAFPAAGVASRARAAYSRTEFFRQPLATAVKTLLTDHVEGLNEHEIYDLLIVGGYAFEESNAEKAKNNLKISLGKNSAFSKSGNGYYVLAPRRKAQAPKPGDETDLQEGNAVASEGGEGAA